MVNRLWEDFFTKYKYENQKEKSFYETIVDASASTRASAVSSCIGGLVIALTIVVARPSFVLTQPGCLYEYPKINLFKVMSIFALVAMILFVLDLHAHAIETDVVVAQV
jgi:hypothetical protein